MIGQPKSAMYGFGTNRLFRSESEGVLPRLQVDLLILHIIYLSDLHKVNTVQQ